MAAGAGALHRHVIHPGDRAESGGVVTVVAAVVGAHMVPRFWCPRSAGDVTADAGLGDAAVIEIDARKAAGDMTVVARRRGLQVVRRFGASRPAGDMTAGAGLGDAAVIESSGGPAAGDMTIFTGIGAGYMFGPLALCHFSIMATDATSHNRIMIHPDDA